MQILFIVSFISAILVSLFIGNAMAGGYAPYYSLGAALLYLFALFMPFLSEYNVLNRGFTKIGDNFKTLMKSEEHHVGDVEIFLPGQRNAPAEHYDLEQPSQSKGAVILVLALATALFSYDAYNYYIVEGAIEGENPVISNF